MQNQSHLNNYLQKKQDIWSEREQLLQKYEEL